MSCPCSGHFGVGSCRHCFSLAPPSLCCILVAKYFPSAVYRAVRAARSPCSVKRAREPVCVLDLCRIVRTRRRLWSCTRSRDALAASRGPTTCDDHQNGVPCNPEEWMWFLRLRAAGPWAFWAPLAPRRGPNSLDGRAFIIIVVQRERLAAASRSMHVSPCVRESGSSSISSSSPSSS